MKALAGLSLQETSGIIPPRTILLGYVGSIAHGTHIPSTGIDDKDLKEEQKRLDDQGILHSIRGVEDLDEAAGAYKDIDLVMEEQKDLVEIVIKLKPLAVIKG